MVHYLSVYIKVIVLLAFTVYSIYLLMDKGFKTKEKDKLVNYKDIELKNKNDL